MRRTAWLRGAPVACILACNGGGGGDTDTTDGTGAAATMSGGPSTGDTPGTTTDEPPTTGGPTVPTGTDGTSESSDTTPPVTTTDGTTGDPPDPNELGGPFRRGINIGVRNPGFSDPDGAWLAGQVGCNSIRVSLPERHLVTWGYDIEVADIAAYADMGLDRHIAFLTSPIAEHSTAPNGTPDWELAHWIPKNLYEPAVVDGKINPDNYWAEYVYKTVSTYKDHVDMWEIWNEPDWVADWNYTETWDTDPPTKEQLVRFGGSIFDYVRMLRVSKEAALLADPDAKIALGGIGYPNFLDALLRYTDNPDGGTVTAEFPETGAAYFDILNYHYYPLWTPGNSDAGADGFFASRDAFAAKMAAAGVPERPYNVTEVGAPKTALNGQPGGVEYARNFYVKVFARAQAEKFVGADWFILSDGDPGDPFGEMGLYQDIKDLGAKEDAVPSVTGVAARTLNTLLADSRADPPATAALGAPADVRAYAFRLPDDRQAIVAWAYALGTDESAQAHFDLPTDKSFDLHAWDFSQTGTATPLAPEGGLLGLDLTASPVILVEQ
ncbi:hypothetical protein SAMN02745121_02347 [Nannocystis exedens]|uniref:Glycosyl hydrolases family 39 n=1 Tax=Nannocystis exedens TaxID=54 RepID=A0A1I1WLT5_9BACT|nr:hypothetical protein [Nannocystis exedens]PCC67710.1 hypothetical protein NAEX_00718 [Nannocystis exedens]SFD94383.1 hypothetical protein SAMN02745121_02347 [Nannocystis exedens]